MAQDEIDRAVARCGVKPGSALESLLRQNFYNVVGTAEENRDEKLDKFLSGHRADPMFADSLVEPIRPPQERGKPQAEKIDPLNLNRETFEQIVAGRISVQK
jgi:hypothetical protein